ncbi:MAG: hypothetical protein FH749_02085 [Firmicutes bacterium]|nr:hypothetical protein [Bacillota bacterium]
MKCQNCGEREARINITQIVNNQKKEVHLCHQCAQQGGYSDPVFGLHKLLTGLVDWEPQAPASRTCPQCGLTEQGFRQTGRLGCEQCYKTWEPLVETILGRIHGRLEHTGKVPKSAGEHVRRSRKIQELKAQLEQAVREEQFETAARLRDEIRALQQTKEGAEDGN